MTPATASMDSSSDDEDAPRNAFDVLMAPPSKKAKTNGSEPIMIAVVYIRWLKWIDPSEPLYGCPYIGQAVRAHSTAELVAKERWMEENRDATARRKRVGLYHAIKAHGPEAFADNIVEWKQGPRSEVQAWADEREVALIAEHGGPLRDPSMRCTQTLNLDHGGKFGMNFEARDALRTVAWLTFQDELEEYVECHGTALVPRLYVNPVSGYKLGGQLHNVRQGGLWNGHPDEAERIEWLEALPKWAWDAKKTEEYREAISERGKAQWANADETRVEWCRKLSEAQNRPEVKAAHSESAKKQFESQEARKELSERSKAQAAREAAEGKPSLGERGKATTTASWTKEQHQAAQAKRDATAAAKRAKVLEGLTGDALVKKQKEYERNDRKEANRKGRANALLQLPEFAAKGYHWCYHNPSAAQKDGVVFFQDEHGGWCARMGNQGRSQGAGSSSEHARTVVGSAEVATQEAAMEAPEDPED